MLELGKPGTRRRRRRASCPSSATARSSPRCAPPTGRRPRRPRRRPRVGVHASAARELIGRWAAEPEDAARLRARQTSWWKGTWVLDLEGTPVELEIASRWKGTHRYLTGGRQLAESGTTGGWSPRPTLTAGRRSRCDHQVFLLWLELVSAGGTRAAGATAAVIGGRLMAGRGRIRAADIALVRERSKIDEIVGEHLQLKRAGGGSLKGLCPFHDEKSPSFQVTPSRGLYHCLAGETGVLTEDGTIPIRELAGKTVRVLNGNGGWVEAPFKSYGVQRLMRLTLTRNGRDEGALRDRRAPLVRPVRKTSSEPAREAHSGSVSR